MKPFDASKFLKSVTKAIPGMSIGFNDPSTWISTGNYTLNYLISRKFRDGGIPLSKVSVLAGAAGSGKSLIASGNVVKDAQKQNIYVYIVDTENALDDKWLTDLGVDTSPEKMTKLNIGLVEDLSKCFFEFVKGYKSEYATVPFDERPKVLWVIDSLGMLETSGATEKVKNGDMRGDMGIKAKQLKAMVTQMVSAIAQDPIGVVATNHVYQSQDQFNPDDVISGGSGFVFASSIIVTMRKLKLKEDENGDKISSVQGIRSKCCVAKTRYSKPFEEVEIKIPYDTGMNPYSGLMELFKKSNVVTKNGNRWLYIDPDTSEEFLAFEKVYNRNDGGILDRIMNQYSRHPEVMKSEVQITDSDDVLQCELDQEVESDEFNDIEE